MFQTFGFEPLSKIKPGDICYDVSVWSEEKHNIACLFKKWFRIRSADFGDIAAFSAPILKLPQRKQNAKYVPNNHSTCDMIKEKQNLRFFSFFFFGLICFGEATLLCFHSNEHNSNYKLENLDKNRWYAEGNPIFYFVSSGLDTSSAVNGWLVLSGHKTAEMSLLL